MVRTHAAVKRLFDRADPEIGMLAGRDLLAATVSSDVHTLSPLVRALLTGLTSEASVRSPYRKWQVARWRLVSLAELGIPPGHESATEACDGVLAHWSRSQRLARVPVVEGRARRCASQEGNAVAVACRLGLHADHRVETLAERLVGWQWPDGGWNCDSLRQAIRPFTRRFPRSGDCPSTRQRVENRGAAKPSRWRPSCCCGTTWCTSLEASFRSTRRSLCRTIRRTGTTTSCSPC